MAHQMPYPAPPGFCFVKNCTTSVYEGKFDGVCYPFQPGEIRLLPDEAAAFLRTYSLLQYDPTDPYGSSVRALARAVNPETGSPDPGWDATLIDRQEIVELINRTHDDNPLGRGAGGVKTKATLIPVAGGRRPQRVAAAS